MKIDVFKEYTVYEDGKEVVKQYPRFRGSLIDAYGRFGGYWYSDNLSEVARMWAEGNLDEPVDVRTGNLVSAKHLARLLDLPMLYKRRAIRSLRAFERRYGA